MRLNAVYASVFLCLHGPLLFVFLSDAPPLLLPLKKTPNKTKIGRTLLREGMKEETEHVMAALRECKRRVAARSASRVDLVVKQQRHSEDGEAAGCGGGGGGGGGGSETADAAAVACVRAADSVATRIAEDLLRAINSGSNSNGGNDNGGTDASENSSAAATSARRSNAVGDTPNRVGSGQGGGGGGGVRGSVSDIDAAASAAATISPVDLSVWSEIERLHKAHGSVTPPITHHYDSSLLLITS